MHRSPFLRGLAAGVALTVLAACGSDSESAPTTSAAPESSPSPVPSTAPGDTSPAVAPGDTSPAAPPNAAAPDALQFTAPLVGGGSLDFTQYAGKTVALWFWAPT